MSSSYTSTLLLTGNPHFSSSQITDLSSAEKFCRLDLDKGTVESLKRSSQRGQTIELSLGTDKKVLTVGDKDIALNWSQYPSSTSSHHQLYQRDPQNAGTLQYLGLLEHRLFMSDAKKQLDSTAAAHAKLQANVGAATNSARTHGPINHMTKSGISVLRAAPKRTRASPALGSRSSNSHLAPPTSTQSLTNVTNHQTSAERAISCGVKVAFMHLLALGPATESTLLEKTKIPKGELEKLLKRHATKSATGHHELNSKCFNELDIQLFQYKTDEDRQSAQKNAIRAFDKQRLSANDALWQKLLPVEDRNTGIILSKLIFAADAPPVDHRKMLNGIGGGDISRAATKKNPLANKSPTAKPGDDKKISTSLPSKDNAPMKGVAVKVKKTMAPSKQYKSAEYVVDDDDDNDSDLATNLIPKPHRSTQASEVKKSFTTTPQAAHSNLANKKRKAEGDAPPRPATGEKTTVSDSKRQKASELMTKHTSFSAVHKSPHPSETSSTAKKQNLSRSENIFVRNSPISRPFSPKVQDHKFTEQAARGSVRQEVDGLSKKKEQQTDSPKPAPSEADAGRIGTNNMLAKAIADPAAKKIKSVQAGPPRKEPAAISTSLSSRPSTFSPSSSASHGTISSASSVASQSEFMVVTRSDKSKSLKRSAEDVAACNNRALNSASSSSKRLRKERPMDKPSPLGSSSPVSPKDDDNGKSPAAPSEAEAEKQSSQYAKRMDASPPVSKSRIDTPSLDVKSQVVSPGHITTPIASDVNHDHIKRYEDLQITFKPAFVQYWQKLWSLSILKMGTMTDDEQSPAIQALTAEYRVSVAKYEAERKSIIQLLREMSPATLQAINCDPDTVARELRYDAARAWHIVPKDWSPQGMLGLGSAFVSYWRQWVDMKRKEYVGHLKDHKAMKTGNPEKETLGADMFTMLVFLEQVERVLGREVDEAFFVEWDRVLVTKAAAFEGGKRGMKSLADW